jgi:hypothetical protein
MSVITRKEGEKEEAEKEEDEN